jgi:hypothetical protein
LRTIDHFILGNRELDKSFFYQIFEDNHMARKAFLTTEAMRGQVRSYAARGTPQDDIAKLIGCDAKTLRKHFRSELDLGMAEANAAMCGYLFATAAVGNVTAQIFWMKTRMGLREREPAEDPTPGTDATSTSHVIILLPTTAETPSSRRYCEKHRRNTSLEGSDNE